MSKKYDVVARVGSYTKNGEEKGKYVNAGIIYEKEGKFGLVLNTPVVIDDDGNIVKFFSLFAPRKKEETQSGNDQTQGGDDFDDDIPF